MSNATLPAPAAQPPKKKRTKHAEPRHVRGKPSTTLRLTFRVCNEDLALMLRFDLIERHGDGYRLTHDGERTASTAIHRRASECRQHAGGYRPTWWGKSLLPNIHDTEKGRTYEFGHRYVCAACDREFKDCWPMGTHMERDHGIDPLDPYKPGVAKRIKQRLAREAEARAARKAGAK